MVLSHVSPILKPKQNKAKQNTAVLYFAHGGVGFGISGCPVISATGDVIIQSVNCLLVDVPISLQCWIEPSLLLCPQTPFLHWKGCGHWRWTPLRPAFHPLPCVITFDSKDHAILSWSHPSQYPVAFLPSTLPPSFLPFSHPLPLQLSFLFSKSSMFSGLAAFPTADNCAPVNYTLK